jgi:hypothetical protein
MQVIANSLQDFGAWGRRVCIIPFSHCPPFSRAHKALVLFKFGFVVSSVDHDLQSHVSIVPTTNLQFATSVATTSARRPNRGRGKFLVVDPRPRPSRFPREVFSGLQEAIGRWVIMNAGDMISVNSCNHYSRVTLMILFCREEVLCHYESRKETRRRIEIKKKIPRYMASVGHSHLSAASFIMALLNQVGVYISESKLCFNLLTGPHMQ